MGGNLAMANGLEYQKEPEDYIQDAFSERTVNELNKLYTMYWDLCSLYGTVDIYAFINYIESLKE